MQFTTILSTITLFASAGTAAPSTSSPAAERRQTIHIDFNLEQQAINDITNVLQQLQGQAAIVQNSLNGIMSLGDDINQLSAAAMAGFDSTTRALDNIIGALNQAASGYTEADGQISDQFE
ncbi:hypothetical protein DL764_005817 [Monosporascus ibericus]|uniref:Uncharacterized protein n=1 Tax=Monosporascus ibericus TaxID=155417 RepID=A0A4V1XAD6_9PEZI|nr:hypothetical protein DL764_005817 [Monosporascus ibericus]